MDFANLLRQEVALPEDQIEKLAAHYALLLRWNKSLNLTRISDIQEAVRLNYHESIILAKALPQGSLRIADVGSGAGFPGIPVAILRPDCRVSLIESHKRKAVFLSEAVAGLANVDVLPVRSEDVHAKFDWIVARAVRPEDVLQLSMANDFALLTTLASLANLQEPASIQKLPWGDQRVLAMFHVKHARIDPWPK